jgi:hypothetical protein
MMSWIGVGVEVKQWTRTWVDKEEVWNGEGKKEAMRGFWSS